MEKIYKSKSSPQHIEDRKKRIYIAKKAAPYCSNFLVFPFWLRYQLAQLDQCGGFALHPLHAQKFYGKKLLIQLPLERIQYAMHDWVGTGAQTLHTSDYFLTSQDLLSISLRTENMQVYRHAQELQAANWEYQKTRVYQQFCNASASGKPITKQQIVLDSIEAVNGYFERFKKLYQSMQKNGMLSNAEISRIENIPPDREIGIALDSSGAIIKLQGGQHRFAIAKLLNISHIPVEVRMIHRDLIAQACHSPKKSPVQAIVSLVRKLDSAAHQQPA